MKNSVTGLVRGCFKIFAATAVLAIATTSCAVVRGPTGGEIDETPPKILSSNPLSGALNFDGNELMFEFDEYVTLKGATKELIVSPPLKYPVEFKMRNKKLFVSWRDTLQENSTYLFQFGNGIADLNEGNVLDSNLFVFSTGDYLDSFEVKGQVIDAFSLAPMADIWVMLYKENIDTLPYSELPRYYAKTNNEGMFHLQYLSSGAYKIFALGPVNSGYLFDVPDESIAFLSDLVVASTPSDTSRVDTSYLMKMFVQEDSTQYIKSFAQEGTMGLIFEFNRAVETIEITDLDQSQNVSKWTESWSLDNDSVTYWFEESLDYDSLKLQVVVDGFVDTIFLRKPTPKRKKSRKGPSKKEPKGLILSTKSMGKHPYYKKLVLTSKMPIDRVENIERSIFVEDGDTIDITNKISKEFYSIVIDHKWKEGVPYRFILLDSIVYDRYGETNDTLIYSFISSQKEDYGQLDLRHSLPDNGHKYIWQLLNKDGKVVDERIVEPEGVIKYAHLPTGKFRVKIYYDTNDNGIWDTGYYPAKRQAEKVQYYNEVIEIRSNWASEIEWILTQ